MSPALKELIRRLDCVVVEDARKQSRAPVSAAVYYLPEDVPKAMFADTDAFISAYDADEMADYRTEKAANKPKKKKMGNNNETMWATVVWPGKDFDGNFGARTSCTVQLADGTEKKMGARPGSGKSNYLKSLKKGDKVPVYWDSMTKDNEKIDYLDVDTWALIESGGASPSVPDVATGDALKQAKNKAYELQLEGIAVARAVAEKAGLQIGDEALFERGGAIGTGLQINLERRGAL